MATNMSVCIKMANLKVTVNILGTMEVSSSEILKTGCAMDLESGASPSLTVKPTQATIIMTRSAAMESLIGQMAITSKEIISMISETVTEKCNMPMEELLRVSGNRESKSPIKKFLIIQSSIKPIYLKLGQEIKQTAHFSMFLFLKIPTLNLFLHNPISQQAIIHLCLEKEQFS